MRWCEGRFVGRGTSQGSAETRLVEALVGWSIGHRRVPHSGGEKGNGARQALPSHCCRGGSAIPQGNTATFAVLNPWGWVCSEASIWGHTAPLMHAFGACSGWATRAVPMDVLRCGMIWLPPPCLVGLCMAAMGGLEAIQRCWPVSGYCSRPGRIGRGGAAGWVHAVGLWPGYSWARGEQQAGERSGSQG